MIGKKIMWSLLLGGAMVVAGCDSDDETPSGTPTAVPQATEEGAEDMQDSAEDAADRAENAADNIGEAAENRVDAAEDALQRNAAAAAEAAAASPAAANAVAQVKQVTDYIGDGNLEMAEKTLAALETNKDSLPAAVQTQITNARTLLDTAKKGAAADPGTTPPPAAE